MIMKKVSLIAIAGLATLALGCTGPASESASEEPTAGSQAISEGPSEAVASVLESYEAIRATLASDQAPGSSQYATLAAAASQAAEEQADAAREALIEMADAAEKVAAAAAQELPEARRQFGEVSEPLIGFLSANPELARGQFVFECPMAKGYPKWVQNSEIVSNPYLGTEMASCGTAAAWTP